ncbi:sensor histidine kinase [Promicromonospora sukumoe]|uniref:sensor histidine kinase n=1 Tax=Promicromonospora sukumoe TaxID=88382 RepID=UPI0036503008
MGFSELLAPKHPMDPLTQRAIGSTVRLLCQVRLVVLAFALVLALLDGAGWLGVSLVMLAAPFSFVPALNWDARGRAYARNGILLAGDVVVAVVTLLPIAGSPLMAIYAAATAALWGLLAGPLLGLVMAVPLSLHQLTVYGDGVRGVVTGTAGAALVVVMTWTGTVLGRRLRRQALTSVALVATREHEAALAERLRLARDLHDTVAGDLAGLALATRGLADRLDREGSDPSTIRLARELSDAVGVAHQHTRATLGELRDDVSGVAGPVTDLARRWTERTGIPTQLSVGPGVDGVAGVGRAQHVRALVAELLENVRKHADASRVEIVVSETDGTVEVLVSDDGAGLSRDLAGGYGMHGVRERSALCGGDATWSPGATGGTAVRVVLPHEPADQPTAAPGTAQDATGRDGTAGTVPDRAATSRAVTPKVA